MFASFAQTAVLYFLYAVYISVLSVGNVRNCHIRYTWLSTAFVGLGILEQVLSYGCDGFESALTGGASGSFEWSTPELDAARADPRYGNANLGEGAAVSDALVAGQQRSAALQGVDVAAIVIIISVYYLRAVKN